jgi:14-3-3 protein epsilon
MATERDVDLWVVQLLDQTDRQEDTVDLMKRVIDAGPSLTSDQRNLLSIVYKKAITSRRDGLRYLVNLLERDDARATAFRLEQIVGFRRQIVDELDRYCRELIALVDEKLLPAAADADARAFYWKLKADYWRYISEHKDAADKAKSADEANVCYEEALAIARDAIEPWKPGYLGLVLNYSVYLYEIVGKQQEAIGLAQKTQEQCSDTVNNNSRESFAEAVNILQLLRENVTLWAQGQQPE